LGQVFPAARAKTAFVGLFFDGQEFVLDKEDLLAIEDILKTVFESMGDKGGVIFPVENREKVMSRAGKIHLLDT